MPDHEADADLSTLSLEGQFLRDALISYDLTEVRFRALRMADLAAPLGFADVGSAALAVIEALGPDGARPSLGYGQALFALSDAINEALKAP